MNRSAIVGAPRLNRDPDDAAPPMEKRFKHSAGPVELSYEQTIAMAIAARLSSLGASDPPIEPPRGLRAEFALVDGWIGTGRFVAARDELESFVGPRRHSAYPHPALEPHALVRLAYVQLQLGEAEAAAATAAGALSGSRGADFADGRFRELLLYTVGAANERLGAPGLAAFAFAQLLSASPPPPASAEEAEAAPGLTMRRRVEVTLRLGFAQRSAGELSAALRSFGAALALSSTAQTAEEQQDEVWRRLEEQDKEPDKQQDKQQEEDGEEQQQPEEQQQEEKKEGNGLLAPFDAAQIHFEMACVHALRNETPKVNIHKDPCY